MNKALGEMLVEILDGSCLRIRGLEVGSSSGSLRQGSKPLTPIIQALQSTMRQFMRKCLQNGLRIADNDATQVLEGILDIARRTDTPRLGVNSLTQETAQPLADNGIAHMDDEVGRQDSLLSSLLSPLSSFIPSLLSPLSSLLYFQHFIKMTDMGKRRQCLMKDDDMAEKEVDVIALEIVGICLSEDNHRTTGGCQTVDEGGMQAVVVASG